MRSNGQKFECWSTEASDSSGQINKYWAFANLGNEITWVGQEICGKYVEKPMKKDYKNGILLATSDDCSFLDEEKKNKQNENKYTYLYM